jgi:hypothetical protein
VVKEGVARFRRLVSLPGVGPIVAATLVIRMPELGQITILRGGTSWATA